MGSPVYQRAVRSLLKRNRLQRRTETIGRETLGRQTMGRLLPMGRSRLLTVSKQEVETSKNIDLMLKRYKLEERDTVKCVILGEPVDTMEVFMILVRTFCPADFHDMVQNCKLDIISFVTRCTTTLLDHYEGDWQSSHRDSIDIFRQQIDFPENLSSEVCSAILRIWQSPHGYDPSGPLSPLSHYR